MMIKPMTPLPSSDSELVEESLCEIFEMAEQNIHSRAQIETTLAQAVSAPVLDRLAESGLIQLKSNEVELSVEGQQLASQVVRRKRLAERLMKDVLNLPDNVIDSAACQWEHVLSKEVTNSICTFLGHPSFSPKEKPIPSGECCRKEAKEVASVICPLDDLKRGDKGKIMYLLLKQRPELNRLLSMGLTPGSEILLIQRVPTFVVQINEAQMAFDETIAAAIFVHPL